MRQGIINIAEICAQKQVRQVVFSSGSRSAPLVLSFARHPNFTIHTVVDERSAAFVALGIAQQTQQPVALVCTSGTAVLNYGPAVAEAFYQQIPLLLLTADRPPEWLDQQDNQTIRQCDAFRQHCRAAYELPVEESHPDALWHIERIVSDAINKTRWPVPGPVHVNVPLREPLYPTTDFQYTSDVKTIAIANTHTAFEDWQALDALWQTSDKKLIVAGMHAPDAQLSRSLGAIQKEFDIPVLCDVTANLPEATQIAHFDALLYSENADLRDTLTPDFLITFAGPLVSKSLKQFLRQVKPPHHWRIQTDFECIDTYQSLTRIVPCPPADFFTQLSERQPERGERQKRYFSHWQTAESRAMQAIESFFTEAPFCELSAMQTVLQRLPRESLLQLGNSSIVRWASYVGVPTERNINVNSNRGTSGIDGTVSTAVGAALTTDKITTLIVGDLAFFYDRNGLWHEPLPANLRIIMFNNHGGGIFRMLDGSKELPELEAHFEVAHDLSAEDTANMHNLEYAVCDAMATLKRALSGFFEAKDRPAILEIRFDKTVNSEAFFKFQKIMREIQ